MLVCGGPIIHHLAFFIVSRLHATLIEVLDMEPKPTLFGKFRKLWKYYLLQSFLAASVLFVIIMVLGREKMVAISTMGATAMIVFAMPKSISAQSRNVIGGHLVGLGSGTLLYFFGLPYFICYPLAVGVAIFLMIALDVEHAPAAGTTLAVLVNNLSADVFLTILVGALVLSQFRYYLRRHLKDLL